MDLPTGLPRDLFAVALCVGLVGMVAIDAVDRSWLPADDGHWAHVAERVLDGEVLHRDVEELHPGLIHFINAGALMAFGRRLVSLRYPVVLLMVLQAILVFAIVRRYGAVHTAFAASVVAGVFGFPQIATPSVSLYATFFSVVLIAVLVLMREGFGRLVSVGLVLGLIFSFRQLTGVLMGTGTLTYLVWESAREAPPGWGDLGQWVGAALAVLLAGYLLIGTDLFGWVLFGVWPVLLLLLLLNRLRANRAELMHLAWALSLGIFAAVLPLLLYQVVQGSAAAWLDQVFVRSLRVTHLEHLKLGSYAVLMLGALRAMTVEPTWVSCLSGAYWMLLLVSGVVLGTWLLIVMRRVPDAQPRALALPMLATFHGLAAVFNQITHYLYVAVPLLLAGVAAMSVSRRRLSPVVASALLGIAAVGVVFQSGQSYEQPFETIFRGQRPPLSPSRLPRSGLEVAANFDAEVAAVVELIWQHASPDEPILVLPNDAELYFLSERPNALPWFNSTLSVQTPEEIGQFRRCIVARTFAVVVFNGRSSYATDAARSLMKVVRSEYRDLQRVGRFEVLIPNAMRHGRSRSGRGRPQGDRKVVTAPTRMP